MSIVIAHPVFFLLSCRLFVSLADDMKWKYSLSSTTNSTLSAVWHLKNATGSWNHSWAPTDWLAHRLPLNFHCLRSCLRRDRWCLCRWMNTLLCALPFGLNISVSNVTNQMFVSCYVQLLCWRSLYMNSSRCWCAQPQSMDNIHSLRLWYIAGVYFEYLHAGGVFTYIWCPPPITAPVCCKKTQAGFRRTGESAAGSCEPIAIISLLSHIC